MNAIKSRVIDSPVGPLTLAGHDGALTNLRMEDQSHPPPGGHQWRRDPERSLTSSISSTPTLPPS